MTNPISTEAAVEAPQTASGTPETDTAVEHTPETDDDAQNDDGRAAKLRHRAQEAEASRDLLAAQLAATRESIIKSQLVAAGFDNERLRNAAGIDVEAVLTDNGEIDAAKLTAAIEAAAVDLNVKPPSRRPIPNPLAGRGGGDRPAPDGLATFNAAFEGRK